MGVPTSEVGYTPAMPRRKDYEVHKDTWWHWTKKSDNIKKVTLSPFKLLRHVEGSGDISPFIIYRRRGGGVGQQQTPGAWPLRRKPGTHLIGGCVSLQGRFAPATYNSCFFQRSSFQIRQQTLTDTFHNSLIAITWPSSPQTLQFNPREPFNFSVYIVMNQVKMATNVQKIIAQPFLSTSDVK